MTEHPDAAQGQRASWLAKLPAYPLLLSMRACSSVILWVDFTLIFSLLSYHWQVGASTLGIASALYGLPGLMLGPLFGRLTDRHPPFKLLYLSYLARSLTSLLLIFAPSTEVFLALVFCKGLGNLGAMPTEQVLVRVLLSQNQIVSNASLTTAIDQISKICAPLVGALLAQWFRPAAGFGLSALLALLHLLQRRCQPLTQKMAERPGATIGALFAWHFTPRSCRAWCWDCTIPCWR
jgi:MFS family permease